MRSATGQIELDWGRQLLTINTPKAQGATGLLGAAGRIELDDIVVECENDLAAILVIAFDEKPLRCSERILIQAVTESALNGSRHVRVAPGTKLESTDRKGSRITEKVPDGAKTIEVVGDIPYQIDCIQATVTFTTREINEAIPADLYGYRDESQKASLLRDGRGVRIVLPNAAYYTIVKYDLSPGNVRA